MVLEKPSVVFVEIELGDITTKSGPARADCQSAGQPAMTQEEFCEMMGSSAMPID